MPKLIFSTIPLSARAAVAILLTVAASLPSSVLAQQTNDNNSPDNSVGSPQDPISIDWDNTSLLEVVESLGALTGRNFSVDSTLKNKLVTIISHHKIPPEMAYDILEAILHANDFAMIDTLDGNIVRIVPKPKSGQTQIGADKLEIFDNTGEAHLGFDNFAIHIVQLKHVAAQEASEFIKKVGSPNVDVVVFQNTNTLLIIDTADGIRNIFKVLETIDIPGYEVKLEIFPLEFTRAEALVDQLNQVLGDAQSSGPSRPGQTSRPVTPRNPRTASIPGQTPTTVVGSGEEVLRMVPDERLNSLIVVASASMMEQVKYMIERLDVAVDHGSNNMHYVPLMHTDAEAVAAVLSSVTSTPPREGSTASANSGEVQPFEKQVTITPYEENNALVIIASPQDFLVLNQLIAQLDTPRKQVNIEAIIMEVTLGTAHEVGVEATAFDDDHIFGLMNVANIANVIAGGPATLAGPGGQIGIIDGTTEVTIAGVTQEVQNVPLLMKALETITDVEVLSRPNILMKDNTEGELFVGREIPIPTAQSDINPNSGFQSRNQISRRNVGIKLLVTPQINEGEYVSMKIEVESSSPVASAIGIDANTTGATIAESTIKSEVVVRDGQTGIIGGLIAESQTNARSQTPILGDLPLIGWLFRSKNHSREKQNLVILITPHIINRTEDLVALTEQGVDTFYEYDTDAIFEKGFFKKTKAKRRARTVERPADIYRKGKSPVPATRSKASKKETNENSESGNQGVIFGNDSASQDTP